MKRKPITAAFRVLCLSLLFALSASAQGSKSMKLTGRVVDPDGFSLVAHSANCPNVAICDESRGFYGVQFHPEADATSDALFQMICR